ncbi:MAG: AAA family ATPase, partial [Clostridia bacterium]|nr:AAA family ATPase [Clostridia bacterium]
MNQTEIKKNNQEKTESSEVRIYLSDLWNGVKKLWWVCLLISAILGASMFIKAYSSYVPVYTASATLTVTTQRSSSVNSISVYTFYYDATTASQLETTFPIILRSNLLQDAICEDMGIDYVPASLNASAVPGTNFFTMTATGRDPQSAYDVLLSAIEKFPSVAKYAVGNIRLELISSPQVPESPSNSSDYTNKAVTGVLIGLIIGVIIILVYMVMRRTIKTKDDIRKDLNVELLGSVPEVKFKKRTKQIDESVLFTNNKVGTGFKESLRVLRNLFANALKNNEKVVMVTSTAPGEGKTTVSTNLALALADYGKKVLVVDADLRHPSVLSLLGEKEEDIDFYAVTPQYKLAELERFNISYMSVLKQNKDKLFLDIEELKEIFNTVRDDYDYIIVDTPPCGLVSDSTYVAQAVDA